MKQMYFNFDYYGSQIVERSLQYGFKKGEEAFYDICELMGVKEILILKLKEAEKSFTDILSIETDTPGIECTITITFK